VRTLAEEGRKIAAIKAQRKSTGSSLGEASRVVEDYMNPQRNSHFHKHRLGRGFAPSRDSSFPARAPALARA
jgi:hypothetical protein